MGLKMQWLLGKSTCEQSALPQVDKKLKDFHVLKLGGDWKLLVLKFWKN